MKYERILNNPISQTVPKGYLAESLNLKKQTQIGSCVIFKHNVDYAIENLNVGIGWDFIHSNHLKNSGNIFRVFLSKLFSSFIRHSYSPTSFLRGEIRPTLKNSLGDRTNSKNYRPVMISSNLFKTFEYCLQPYLKKNLNIDEHQFAYKKGCTLHI